MLPVHLRINDAATGKPTPVRLRVTGPDDTYFAPFGRLTEFACGRNEDVTGGHLRVGRESFCYIDGACEIRLPADVPVRVQAFKGPEYEPLDRTVTLGPGQMALRFPVKRWSDVRSEGWYAGDARVHFLSPHAAALEAAAEDVAVVNLLATAEYVPSQNGKLYPSVANLAAFSGQSPAFEANDVTVAVNTLNAHPALGSLALLHAHRTVFPLAFGGADDTDDWSVSDWCDQCHRKNGLAVWVNPFDPDRGLAGGEALVALLLGKVDAIEFDGRPRRQPLLQWWYRVLNAGLAVPMVGASGKDSNAVALGTPRTYARLRPWEPPLYANWVNAVRVGRCFVTNGPLLSFDVNGQDPGGTVEAGDGEAVRVIAFAASATPFEKLEVVADGHVVGSATPTREGPRWAASLQFDHTPTESGWLAARCFSTGGTAFAHTAPVLAKVGGRPLPRRPDALPPLRALVEQTREWAERHGRYADEKWRRHLLDLCDAALARLAE